MGREAIAAAAVALAPPSHPSRKWVKRYPDGASSPTWWDVTYPQAGASALADLANAALHEPMTLSEAIAAMTTHPRPFPTREVLAMASRHGLEGAVRRRDVVRVLPGLYAASLHAESWQVRALAALEWAPDAALAGASALFAYGALPDAPSRVEILVPREGRRRYPAWIAPRRSDLPLATALWDPYVTAADAGDGSPLVDGRVLSGYRILDPALAVALGYGAQLPATRAEFVYGPVRAGATTPAQIAAAVASLPRVRARAGLLRRLALASDGMESYLEEVGARDVLAGPAFAGLVRQHRLRAGGASWRADAYHAPSMIDFEFDGARFHDPRRLEDCRRDALLAAEGVLTVRFGYADVMNRPQWCREVALKAIRQRVREGPLGP